MDYNLKEFTGRNERLETRMTLTKSYSIGFPPDLPLYLFLTFLKTE